jgi:hypothetical protein
MDVHARPDELCVRVTSHFCFHEAVNMLDQADEDRKRTSMNV